MRLRQAAKQTKTLLICLVSSVTLLAQQSPVDSVVQICFPEGAERLSTEQLRTAVETDKNWSPIQDVVLNSKGETYRIGSFLLKVYAEIVSVPESQLEESKNNFAVFFRKFNCTTCTSEIKTVNNFRVVIIKQDSKDWGYYAFYSVNESHNSAFNGMLYYGRSEINNSVKAQKTIEELLENTRYKNK